MSALPERKHPRLKEYDYSQNGCYFVTICTKDKAKILCDIVGRGFLDAPLTELSGFGQCVNESINYINSSYRNIHIDKYVIMPNHLHLMIVIKEKGDGGASGKPRPTEAVIPKLVSSFKRFTNRTCGKELWQDGYYDHIIRDEADYLNHWQYIDSNPAKWAEDEYFTEERGGTRGCRPT